MTTSKTGSRWSAEQRRAAARRASARSRQATAHATKLAAECGPGPGTWLRAARAASGRSQRELAELAGVPRTTVERIESGAVVPRMDTVERLLAAVDLELAILDSERRMLTIDPGLENVRDGAARRLPAHLPAGPTPGFMEWDERGREWWGWLRIAWLGDARWTPPFTYWRRRPQPAEPPSDADRVPDGLGLDEGTEA